MKANDAISYLTNYQNIKSHANFLTLFVTFITDEYLPFMTFSHSQAKALGLPSKEEVVRDAYNAVLHNMTGVAGAHKGLIAMANNMVKKAYDEITDKKRYEVTEKEFRVSDGEFTTRAVYEATIKDTTAGINIYREMSHM